MQIFVKENFLWHLIFFVGSSKVLYHGTIGILNKFFFATTKILNIENLPYCTVLDTFLAGVGYAHHFLACRDEVGGAPSIPLPLGMEEM